MPRAPPLHEPLYDTPAARVLSALDDFDSVEDSEEPTSSVIRLPHLFSSAFSSTTPVTASGIQQPPSTPNVPSLSGAPQSIPPPLPPKPLFARSTSLQRLPIPLQSRNEHNLSGAFPPPSTPPPPLPPKPGRLTTPPALPAAAHPQRYSQEKLHQQQIRRARLKKSFEEDRSLEWSNFDELGWIDRGSFPPDRQTEQSAQDVDLAAVTQIPPGATFYSDRFASLQIPLPFPPPPFTAADRATCAAILPLTASLQQTVLHLSAESTDDVNIGAVVLSRSRRKASGSGGSSDESVDVDRAGVVSGVPHPDAVQPVQPQPQPPLPPRPSLQGFYSSSAPTLSALASSMSSAFARSPSPASSPPHEDEVWAILRDYLFNNTLGAHGRAQALQSLASAVVRACAEDDEDDDADDDAPTANGLTMLTEMVRRMHGVERVERDGSVFTLLVNLAAAHGGGPTVERVTRQVFSNVVEEMHGRQDDKVMWERALRCYHILLKTSNYHVADHYHGEYNFRSNSNNHVSTKCIMALALHVNHLAHADIDHVLVANGLCPRLRAPRNDPAPGIIDIDKRVLLDIGGVDAITSLLVNTPSVTTRHILFGIAFDVAIMEAVETISSDVSTNGSSIVHATDIINDNLVLKDQITVFRSFFHSYDMADLLVHSFRVGPWSSFVPDLLRMLLLQPLTHDVLPSPSSSPFAAADTVLGKENETKSGLQSKQLDSTQDQTSQKPACPQQPQPQQPQQAQTTQPQSSFQQKRNSGSVADSYASEEDAIPEKYQPLVEAYVWSVAKLMKNLEKRLCLQTLQRLQYMAEKQSVQVQRRENMHHHREWRLLKGVEMQIQRFCTHNIARQQLPTNSTLFGGAFSTGGATNYQSFQQQQLQLQQRLLQHHGASLDSVLEKMLESIVELTSQRASLRALCRMMELLIEFFTIRPPFGTSAKLYAGIHFQPNLHELHVEAGRDSVARLFLRGQIGAPRSLLFRARAAMFKSLLVASRQQTSVKRVSENRQCLVEFLGISKERARGLKEFQDDEDAAVAYRAREIVCKYSDSSSHVRSRSLTTFDEED